MRDESSPSVRRDAVPRADVLRALEAWAGEVRRAHPEVLRIGCFGSYARGDYGPGSDLDVIIEVSESRRERWFDRPLDFPLAREVPVPVELFVYTKDELERMAAEGDPWLERVLSEAVWI